MQKEQLIAKFQELYGEGGEIRTYFAPGRVNLIGEHTDYNGGHVFPCALTMGTWAVVRNREDRKLGFFSLNFEKLGIIETSLDELIPSKNAGWTNYPKGVMWAFEKRGYELTHGMDILIYGNIPNGCNCGIMDQFASAMGKKDHAIFLDTNTLKYEYAPVVLENAKIVIINSKVKHSLVDSAYNDRRNECETALKELQKVTDIKTLGDLTEDGFEQYKDAIKDPVRQKRAKHAVYENQRTIRAVEALRNNDVKLFGQLMNASHESLRYDYEVSCEEIDILVDLAQAMPGVIGSRITGGGFGGCTVSIVEEGTVDKFIEEIGKTYKEKVGHEAEFYVVDIGDGAKIV